MNFKIKLFLVFVIIATSLLAQEEVRFVTYGNQAETKEGDDNANQMIFIKVQKSYADSLFLRIFDADCGERIDTKFGEFDSETKFSFYGGSGAYSKTVNEYKIVQEERKAGNLIRSEKFGIDPFKDNKWYNFSKFQSAQGDTLGDYTYFKLLIEGISGNDANAYNVTVSSDEKRNILPKEVEIFSFFSTIRLPSKGIFAEIRYFVPAETKSIVVHNFDLARAKLSAVTPFRSGLPIPSSNQDEWASGAVDFEQNEKNNINAVIFEGGNEIPNDATFYLTDDEGLLVPIQHPIYIHKKNNRPIASAAYKILSDCYSVVFDGSGSSDKDDDALDFYWDFGDGTKGEGVRIAHTYQELRNYPIQLIVKDGSGQVGNSALYNFVIEINQPPKADAGKDLIAAPGEPVDFSGSLSSDPDGSVTGYSWEFGEGTRGEGQNIKHEFKNTGNYTVTLRVEDNSNSPCNFDTDQLSIWINSAPIVDIGENKIGAVSEELTFNGGKSYDSDGEITEYLWDFGDGSTGTGLIVKHAYAAPGMYTVGLKVVDNSGASNGSAKDILTVKINEKPIAEAGADQIVSAGQVVNFSGSASKDNDGSIVHYSWIFGDGGTGSGKDITHVFAKPGKYIVNLKVQDNSTTISEFDDDNLTVVVNYPPIAVAGDDQYVSTGIVKFDASKSSDRDGNLTNYKWDFGDGSVSSDPTPTHIYSAPGTYQTVLTVTDDVGTSTSSTSDSMTVVINAPPIADAGIDQIGSPNENLKFDGSNSVDPDGTIKKYFWKFGDGTEGEGAVTAHSYKNPGTYSVQLKVEDNSGHTAAVSYDNCQVVVNAAPVADAGADVVAAPNQKITFDGSNSYDPDGSIVRYEWEFSDDKSKSEKKIVKKSFENAGIYNAILKVYDNSGSGNPFAEEKVSIYINHEPQAFIGKDIRTCERVVAFDGSKSVDADGDALLYYWDFGDGTKNDTGMTVVHTYENSGTYPVILTVNDNKNLNNSENSTSISTTINEAPVADAGENRTLCAGEIVLFDASASVDPEGGLLKYEWDFGDGTKAEGLNPTKVYNNGGVYSVTLKIKDDSGLPCNFDQDQIVVTVAESPVAVAGEDQVVCANSLVQFDGRASKDFDGVVNSFTWDFGDGAVGGGSTPTHVYTEPGTYRVLLTITGDLVGECDNSAKDELTVTVQKAGKANFNFAKFVELNTPVAFDASESSGQGSNIVAYNWDFGDGTVGKGETTSHNYSKPGKYFVELTIETDSKAECSSIPVKDFIIVNAPPTAFAGEDQIVSTHETVVFNAERSIDPDGSIISYEWDFGDGTTGDGIRTEHKYTTAGTYKVILNILDDTQLSNNSDSDDMIVTVIQPLTGGITSENSACVEEEIKFSALMEKSDSSFSYFWKFGDGSEAVGASVTHKFSMPGTFDVNLTVDDGSEMVKSVTKYSKRIMVNSPPVIQILKYQEVCPEQAVSFDAGKSYDLDGEIVRFVWDFGDGTSGEGIKTSHIFETTGKYNVSLRAFDDSKTDCGFSEQIITVVVNSSPVPRIDFQNEVFIGGAYDFVTFDAGESFDPDNETVTCFWDFGDGEKAYGTKVSHKYARAGVYRIKLTVKDDSNLDCGVSQLVSEISVKKR